MLNISAHDLSASSFTFCAILARVVKEIRSFKGCSGISSDQVIPFLQALSL